MMPGDSNAAAPETFQINVGFKTLAGGTLVWPMGYALVIGVNGK
jgi:hypothetical protein